MKKKPQQKIRRHWLLIAKLLLVIGVVAFFFAYEDIDLSNQKASVLSTPSIDVNEFIRLVERKNIPRLESFLPAGEQRDKFFEYLSDRFLITDIKGEGRGNGFFMSFSLINVGSSHMHQHSGYLIFKNEDEKEFYFDLTPHLKEVRRENRKIFFSNTSPYPISPDDKWSLMPENKEFYIFSYDKIALENNEIFIYDNDVPRQRKLLYLENLNYGFHLKLEME